MYFHWCSEIQMQEAMNALIAARGREPVDTDLLNRARNNLRGARLWKGEDKDE